MDIIGVTPEPAETKRYLLASGRVSVKWPEGP